MGIKHFHIFVDHTHHTSRLHNLFSGMRHRDFNFGSSTFSVLRDFSAYKSNSIVNYITLVAIVRLKRYLEYENEVCNPQKVYKTSNTICNNCIKKQLTVKLHIKAIF